MAQTIDRAFAVMRLFSEARPLLGLTDVTRLSGFDKATAYRLLTSLVKHGMLEQDASTKQYMLGAALLNLARIREVSFPTTRFVDEELAALVNDTGETCHVCWRTSDGLAPLSVIESAKANRVSSGLSTLLPYHATASGFVVLAFSTEVRRRKVLSGPFTRHTARTPKTKAEVSQLVEQAGSRGFAIADQTYEDEVLGVAAPLFNGASEAAGAIATVIPSHRANPDVVEETARAVVGAALRLTRRLGHQPPREYLATDMVRVVQDLASRVPAR
jgi:DNA-binding IclR family transcriptional regulator